MLYNDARNLTIMAANRNILKWTDDKKNNISIRRNNSEESLCEEGCPVDLESVIQGVKDSKKVQNALISSLDAIGVEFKPTNTSILRKEIERCKEAPMPPLKKIAFI